MLVLLRLELNGNNATMLLKLVSFVLHCFESLSLEVSHCIVV